MAEATDDYGIAELKLRYHFGVNESQEVALNSNAPPLSAIEEKATDDSFVHRVLDGSYTFYIEEFDLEPGDVISYYAHATDNNTQTGPGEASSDIYFIEIRPFNEDFHEGEAEQAQAQAEPNPLSGIIASQKQIIRDTWKHTNAQSTTREEYQSAVKQTADKQAELKDKTQKFVDELSVAIQTTAQVSPEILMNLEDAIGNMGEATDHLNAIEPAEAIPPEQNALELLIKVNLEIPKVLMQMRNSNPQLAEDFELEMEELQSELENAAE